MQESEGDVGGVFRRGRSFADSEAALHGSGTRNGSAVAKVGGIAADVVSRQLREWGGRSRDERSLTNVCPTATSGPHR